MVATCHSNVNAKMKGEKKKPSKFDIYSIELKALWPSGENVTGNK